MTKLFLEVDITSGVVLVAVMAIVLVRFFKKRKKNVAEAADISPEPSKVTQSFDGRLLSKYAMI